ncbi:BA14K family protein [Labrenzia sp. 011]|uniref:BA14K family protein n=1 Tax=Labrenzia sp. 011 TaxID=2171494 RepID=UPI000D5092B5|nr:BA14K family protein [Labrenzia sp. 011]PVB61101.1 hypothetical protein DCO57_14285 [Labrenzia sp. 011]
MFKKVLITTLAVAGLVAAASTTSALADNHGHKKGQGHNNHGQNNGYHHKGKGHHNNYHHNNRHRYNNNYHYNSYKPRRGNNWHQHVAWCYDRYNSYRAQSNTFQPYNGPRRQCRSPFFRG